MKRNKVSATSKILLLSSVAMMTGLVVNPAHAIDPSNSWDYDTATGNVSKDVTTPGQTNITVTGGNGRASGDANIYAGHTVDVQGTAGAIFAYTDNRDNIESVLSGSLTSNMNIVIIDKDGLIFQNGSSIDAAGLVATTADSASYNAADDIATLTNFAADSSIEAHGSITVADGGLVALVAPTVIHTGTITANAGRVFIGAAETVTFDFYGDGLIEFSATGDLNDALVENTGSIIAQGGLVEISVAAAMDTLDNVVNNTGIIDTYDVSVEDDEIVISASSGTVRNTGEILSNGDITITSERVLQEADVEDPIIAASTGDINIETTGDVIVDAGEISTETGSIDINNDGGFFSTAADTVRITDAGATGTISIRQNDVTDATIQEAVDAVDNAGSGLNTITVGAGTYEEAVTIYENNFAVIGANAGVLGYDAGRGAESFILSDSYGFMVDSALNVTIDGFEIDTQQLDGGDGIMISNSDAVNILNNKISADGDMHWKWWQSHRGDNGVEVGESFNVLVDGNDILTGDRAVATFGGGEVVVSNNEVAREGHDEFRDGIYASSGVQGYDVIDNTIYLVDNDAIEVERGLHQSSEIIALNDDINISGNVIFQSGITAPISNVQAINVAYTSVADVVGNTVLSSTGTGITLDGVEDAFVVDNIIQDTDLNGLNIISNADTDFVGSEIYYLDGNVFTDAGVVSGNAMARITTGEVEFGSNSFVNTTASPATALQFDGADVSILGDTLGATNFDGFSDVDSFFVRIEDGTLLDGLNAPIVIDGSDSVFDGVAPSSFTNSALPEEVLAALEARIYDADDVVVNGRGQIFVGNIAVDPELDNFEDFLRDYALDGGEPGAASLTITSLPLLSLDLQNLAPQAGGEGEGNADDVANIEPAAGGSEVGCASDAASGVDNGPVTYNFGGTFEDSIANEADCGS